MPCKYIDSTRWPPHGTDSSTFCDRVKSTEFEESTSTCQLDKTELRLQYMYSMFLVWLYLFCVQCTSTCMFCVQCTSTCIKSSSHWITGTMDWSCSILEATCTYFFFVQPSDDSDTPLGRWKLMLWFSSATENLMRDFDPTFIFQQQIRFVPWIVMHISNWLAYTRPPDGLGEDASLWIWDLSDCGMFVEVN
jgi:hypothetical protein